LETLYIRKTGQTQSKHKQRNNWVGSTKDVYLVNTSRSNTKYKKDRSNTK